MKSDNKGMKQVRIFIKSQDLAIANIKSHRILFLTGSCPYLSSCHENPSIRFRVNLFYGSFP